MGASSISTGIPYTETGWKPAVASCTSKLVVMRMALTKSPYR